MDRGLRRSADLAALRVVRRMEFGRSEHGIVGASVLAKEGRTRLQGHQVMSNDIRLPGMLTAPPFGARLREANQGHFL